MSQRKHKKTYQRILLKTLPCVLFLGAVFCFSYYFFEAKIVNSSIWSLLVASDAALISQEGTVLNTNMQVLDLEDKDESGFYSMEDFPAITWGEQWAALSIPAHGVENAPVFLGDGDDILNQMVIGQYFGSMFPGQGGKTVLDSHVSGYFHCIEDMKVGDRIVMDTIYGRYEYQVSEIVIFGPKENKWVRQDDSGQETLFCYTCYPRDAAYRSKRIGALCEKVSGTPWR